MLNNGAYSPIFAPVGSVECDEVRNSKNAIVKMIDHDFTILRFKFINKTLQDEYYLIFESPPIFGSRIRLKTSISSCSYS